MPETTTAPLMATTLVYARTACGVVQVDPGDPAPSDTLAAEVARLTSSGALVRGAPDQGEG